MSTFEFSPAECVPFRDKEAVARVRAITRENITKHPNPDLKIEVIPDAELQLKWLLHIYEQIKMARDENRTCVLITPQPWPGYKWVAEMININRLDCSHLYTFNMDEYANEHGQTPPATWEYGFMYSMMTHFYANIDPKLRPPIEQLKGPTSENINDYGKMIADMGGADFCYSGPGWTGHLAFVEPDCPEFDAPLEEWKQMGPRICTLSPFTIAQNSLHGSFGLSGDLTAVPPKAATIGPAEVIGAKNRIDLHGITVDGSQASWQRTMSRLCLHGPVTPKLPTSIHQLLRTDVWMTESIAEDIRPRWDKGY
jgi:glucosamine-6-phosphate deaminase